MIYFSCKPIPSDVDTTQLNKLRKFKKQVEKKELYGEFKDEKDLEEKLYNHIQIKIAERKFRSTFDSDIISKIKDDEKMAEEISKSPCISVMGSMAQSSMVQMMTSIK